MASRFVHRDGRGTPSPVAGQPRPTARPDSNPRLDTAANGRRDRAPAADLKFTNKSKSAAKGYSQTPLASTAPAPGYVSNQTGHRNTYPNPQYQHDDFPRDTLDDTTVSSGFDLTKSEVGVFEQDLDQPDEEYYQGDGMVDVQENRRPVLDKTYPGSKNFPQHTNQHENDRLPPADPGVGQMMHKPQGTSISGRFEVQGRKHNLTLLNGQNRHGHGAGQELAGGGKGTRKRMHPVEAPRTIAVESEQQESSDYEYDGSEAFSGHLPDGPIPRENEESSGTEQAPPASDPARQRRSRPIQQAQATSDPENDGFDARMVPDYKDEFLRKKTYADLEKEKWDDKPDEDLMPEEGKGRMNTIQTRQNNYMSKISENLRDSKQPLETRLLLVVKEWSQDDQIAFFEALSTEDWEDAGDWFLEQFGKFIQVVKDNRQAKRRRAEQFEAEIKKRERAVRKKAEHFEGEFKGMSKAGQALLGDKMA